MDKKKVEKIEWRVEVEEKLVGIVKKGIIEIWRRKNKGNFI